jgi:hypothetical protein
MQAILANENFKDLNGLARQTWLIDVPFCDFTNAVFGGPFSESRCPIKEFFRPPLHEFTNYDDTFQTSIILLTTTNHAFR